MCLVSKIPFTPSCEVKLDSLLGYNSKKKKKKENHIRAH